MTKTKASRKSYPVELKKRAVAMSYEDHLSLADVANELGITVQQLSSWRSKFGQNEATKDAFLRLDTLEENRQLKEALKQARMENEILKKAAVFFASQK